jgi:hypothetical protein
VAQKMVLPLWSHRVATRLLSPTDEHLKLVERLLERITSMKNAGLMGQAVVCTSLLRRMLPLKVRAFPMWDYIRISHLGGRLHSSEPQRGLNALVVRRIV